MWCEAPAADPAAFWRLTPRLLGLALQGRRRAAKAEHAGRAWLAYHAAYLPNAKERPKLSDLMGLKPDLTAGRQTLAEMEVAMRKWRFVMADAGKGAP